MDVRKVIEYLKFYWDALICLVRKKFIRPKKLSELTWGEIEKGIKEFFFLFTKGKNKELPEDIVAFTAFKFAQRYGWFSSEDINSMSEVICQICRMMLSYPQSYGLDE